MRIIAGEYGGRYLKSTSGPGLRPAMGKVREALFSMLISRGIHWPDIYGLDLFAGTGSLGFEALSRGAGHMSFVEMAPYAVKTLEENRDLLKVAPARVSIIQKDVAKFLSRGGNNKFNLVFIDPPYKLNAIAKSIHALINNQWLGEKAIINAEIEENLELDPEKISDELELLEDRAYGQTRVILWKMKK